MLTRRLTLTHWQGGLTSSGLCECLLTQALTNFLPWTLWIGYWRKVMTKSKNGINGIMTPAQASNSSNQLWTRFAKDTAHLTTLPSRKPHLPKRLPPLLLLPPLQRRPPWRRQSPRSLLPRKPPRSLLPRRPPRRPLLRRLLRRRLQFIPITGL